MKWCWVVVILNGCSSIFAQEIAFTISDSLFIPEGITYSKREHSFFVSSVNRASIVRVKDGVVTTFVSARQHEFSGGIGLHADDQRGSLWALGTSPDQRNYQSALYEFDLRTGGLRKKYYPQDANSQLNDVVVAPDGDVYVTDTNGQAIYWINTHSGKLERWVMLEPESYPNGIVADEKYVYVATYSKGLMRFDRETRQTKVISNQTAVVARGIDGLALSGNRIFGVWNAAAKSDQHFVGWWELDGKREMVVKAGMIDKGSPLFQVPTTCVAVDGVLYVIANSHLDLLDDSGGVKPEGHFTNPMILRYPIR